MPPDFQPLLDRLTAPVSARDRLEQLKTADRWDIDFYEPEVDEVLRFLNGLRAVLQDAPPQPERMLWAAREDAIAAIAAFADSADPNVKFFKGINRYTFAFQLAMRCIDPTLIDQRSTDYCGINSVMVSFAMREPLEFAKMALEFAELGYGHFNGLLLRIPGSQMDATTFRTQQLSYWSRKRLRRGTLVLSDADLVILGGCLIALDTSLLRRGASELVVKHWFLAAKFKPVCVDVRPWKRSLLFRIGETGAVQKERDERIKKLKAAVQKVDKGHTVILDVNDDMIHQYFELAGTPLNEQRVLDRTVRKPKISNHWVAAKKILIDKNTEDVTAHIFSWGQTYTCEGVPIDQFVYGFSGYISALYLPYGTTPTAAKSASETAEEKT